MARIHDLRLRDRVALRVRRRSLPQKGDKVWHRGRLCVVTSVNIDALGISFENDYYKHETLFGNLKFDPTIGMWYIPGMEGEMPKVVHGKLVFPEPPCCPCCSKHTLRKAPCRNCEATPTGQRWIRENLKNG